MPRFQGLPVTSGPRFGGTPVESGYDANQTLNPEYLAESRPKPLEFGQGDGAGFGALVKAGTVDDPQTKINIFAKARGISPDKYAVIDGGIYYQGDDGKMYKESPGGVSGFGKELAANTIANGPSVALSTAGSIAGGVLGSAGGPAGTAAGAIAGAGVGGAAGEGYRKLIGGTVFGEPQTIEGNLKSVAKEGALSSAGEAAGRLVAKGFKEIKLRRNIRDMDKLNDAAIKHVQELAEKYNVQLTPAELTGLRSLSNQQWYLSQSPESADTIVSFLKNREPELQRAMYEYFDTLSKNAAPYDAVLNAQSAARRHVNDLKEARKQATNALYKQAEKEGGSIDVTDAVTTMLKSVNDDPGSPGASMTKNILNRILGEPQAKEVVSTYKTLADSSAEQAKRGITLSPGSVVVKPSENAVSFDLINGAKSVSKPGSVSVTGQNVSYTTLADAAKQDAERKISLSTVTGSNPIDKYKIIDSSGNQVIKVTAPISKLHQIKVDLDAALGSPKAFMNSKESMERGYLKGVRDKIASALESQSKSYAAANTKYAEMSKPINEIETGLMGNFVQADSEQAQKLASRLFDNANSSVQAVAQAKKIISSVDPESWNGMVRAYAQRKVEDGIASLKNRMVDSEASNVGGAFIKFDKRLMRAALDPDQVQALDDIDYLLRQTTRSFKGNSITVPAQGVAREIKDDAVASAGIGAKLAMALPKLAQAPSRIVGWIESNLEGNYQENLAKIITDKNSMKKLREQTMKLRDVGPISQKYFPALASSWSVVFGNSLPTESSPMSAETGQGQKQNRLQ